VCGLARGGFFLAPRTYVKDAEALSPSTRADEAEHADAKDDEMRRKTERRQRNGASRNRRSAEGEKDVKAARPRLLDSGRDA